MSDKTPMQIQLCDITRKVTLPMVARQVLEPSLAFALLGKNYQPTPPTWRQMIMWRIKRARERLGEMIAGRKFDDGSE